MVHFRNKNHKKYPDAMCGYKSFKAEVTEDIDEVTCKACLRAYNSLETHRNRVKKSIKYKGNTIDETIRNY